MKALGIKQFQQKKFDLLPLGDSKFRGILGNIPKAFMMIVYGKSGNGKTEFCIQLAKELAVLSADNKIAWLSYEQGHGYDFQAATLRNGLEEVSGQFIPIDPVANLPKGVTFLEDLDKYLSRRNSPKFIFIDSLDYTRFNWEDYDYLKRKYGRKKTFIWLSHAKGNAPYKRIGEQIAYDGGIGIYIHQFIARVNKNRFGGFEDYIIFEERARELNPLYFEMKAKGKPTGKKKKKARQPGLFDADTAPEQKGNLHLPPVEAPGVNAKNQA